MSKRTKKNTPKCDPYLFSLKPLHNYCKFSQTISVSFCDSSKHRRQKQSSDQNDKGCLDCPVFNNDNNFATPTFILHSERGEKMRNQHEKKMIEYTDEKDSLNLPKPRSKNSFCNVCRQTYEDYLNSENHKKCIRNSNFNKFILQLVDKFNPSHKSSLNFIQNTHSTQDQDDVEILQYKPRKKVKPSEEPFERTYQPGILNPILPPPHLNLGHGTYFPSNYPGFVPNSCYNFIYPFGSFPPVDMTQAVNQPQMSIGQNQMNMGQNQMTLNQNQMQNPISYGFPNQNYNFMSQWPNEMAQYMGMRRIWEEEKLRQSQMSQIAQMNQMGQLHPMNQMGGLNQMNQISPIPLQSMGQFGMYQSGRR